MSIRRHTLLAPFSWSRPLGRPACLGSSFAAAFAFLCMQLAVLIASFELGLESLPNSFGLFFFLFLATTTFLAATASPFVIPLICLMTEMTVWLPKTTVPQLPVWQALPLLLLSLALMLACLLRLMALAVRRRRDAGKHPLHFFAISGIGLLLSCACYAESICLCNGSRLNHVAHMSGFFLTVAAQAFMLLRPTKHLPTA